MKSSDKRSLAVITLVVLWNLTLKFLYFFFPLKFKNLKFYLIQKKKNKKINKTELVRNLKKFNSTWNLFISLPFAPWFISRASATNIPISLRITIFRKDSEHQSRQEEEIKTGDSPFVNRQGFRNWNRAVLATGRKKRGRETEKERERESRYRNEWKREFALLEIKNK